MIRDVFFSGCTAFAANITSLAGLGGHTEPLCLTNGYSGVDRDETS